MHQRDYFWRVYFLLKTFVLEVSHEMVRDETTTREEEGIGEVWKNMKWWDEKM